jgi:hypothetical protein
MPDDLWRRYSSWTTWNSLDKFKEFNKGINADLPTIRFF